FISAVYGILDTNNGTFTVARAGHCPVVMVRDGGGPWLLRSDGLGLGLDAGPVFRRTIQEQEIHLVHGDVFALFTDGLVETRNGTGEEYGYDRIASAIAKARNRTAENVLNALLTEQTAFSEKQIYDDDLTILVLKWTGTTSQQSNSSTSEPFTVRPTFA
ncbi:MAG: PP2C family protein-serine/threonine phosphatase, partial [Rubricoccaceae bacterium]|nr:PP2C family protein-serine/threonine phosphatase [Rubricoccaceae bacterium]